MRPPAELHWETLCRLSALEWYRSRRAARLEGRFRPRPGPTRTRAVGGSTSGAPYRVPGFDAS